MDPHVRDNFLAMGPHLIVRKTSDETDSTGVLQNDDNLLLAVSANEIWQFRCNLLVVSASTTDFKFALTFPSGSISAMGWSGGGAVVAISDVSATASPSATGTLSTTSTVSNHVILEGVVSIGGSGGNLQLQWSGQAAAACTVKANSTLWAVKLA
jgi:hypothetical protein